MPNLFALKLLLVFCKDYFCSGIYSKAKFFYLFLEGYNVDKPILFTCLKTLASPRPLLCILKGFYWSGIGRCEFSKGTYTFIFKRLYNCFLKLISDCFFKSAFFPSFSGFFKRPSKDFWRGTLEGSTKRFSKTDFKGLFEILDSFSISLIGVSKELS